MIDNSIVSIELCQVVPGTQDLFLDTFQVSDNNGAITIVGLTETKVFSYIRAFDILVPSYGKHFTSVYRSFDEKHLLFTFCENDMLTAGRTYGDGLRTEIAEEVMGYIRIKFLERN